MDNKSRAWQRLLNKNKVKGDYENRYGDCLIGLRNHKSSSILAFGLPPNVLSAGCRPQESPMATIILLGTGFVQSLKEFGKSGTNCMSIPIQFSSTISIAADDGTFEFVTRVQVFPKEAREYQLEQRYQVEILHGSSRDGFQRADIGSGNTAANCFQDLFYLVDWAMIEGASIFWSNSVMLRKRLSMLFCSRRMITHLCRRSWNSNGKKSRCRDQFSCLHYSDVLFVSYLHSFRKLGAVLSTRSGSSVSPFKSSTTLWSSQCRSLKTTSPLVTIPTMANSSTTKREILWEASSLPSCQWHLFSCVWS